MTLLAASLATGMVFLVLDLLWLTQVATPMFQAELGPLLRPMPLLSAAAAFYVIYLVAMVALVVQPALAAASAAAALWRGAILGLAAYATFDLTNLAVLQGWSLRLSLIDMAWGTLVTAVAAIAGYAAGRRVGASIVR